MKMGTKSLYSQILTKEYQQEYTSTIDTLNYGTSNKRTNSKLPSGRLLSH